MLPVGTGVSTVAAIACAMGVNRLVSWLQVMQQTADWILHMEQHYSTRGFWNLERTEEAGLAQLV
jgi:hypothetical protein